MGKSSENSEWLLWFRISKTSSWYNY